MLTNLFGKIMGFLVIIITLALAPTINTSNTAIVDWSFNATINATQFLGMSVVSTFGAPLIIIGLLVAGGAFAMAGVSGKMQGATVKDLLAVVGSVILVIVGLTFMVDIMDYTWTLIDASTGFAVTLYSIIPLVIYLGVIAGAGWTQVSTYRRLRGGSRRTVAATGF